MSDKNATGVSSSGDDRTVSLRAYATLERELSALKELIDIRSDGEKATLQDVWIAGQPVGRIIESNRKTAKSAEKEARAGRSNPSDCKGQDGTNGDESGDDGLLPIERMAKLKEQNEEHPALPTNGKESFDRALSIYENFKSWSKRTPKGRTVTSGLRTLLETATGTSLAWRQVYRAMDMLERWTNGLIRHEQTNRHGHVLVASERVSSAPTG